MVLVSSQVELFSFARCRSRFSLFADRRMRKVVVVATSYCPQKVRLEDSGERRRTSNPPMRILVELGSRNRKKTHFLHRKTTRIRSSRNRGWH